MNFIQNQAYCAGIVMTDKFICINTESGYGLVTIDPDFPSIILPLDSTEQVLGEKLLCALKRSNTQINDEDYNILFNPENMKEKWNRWLNQLKLDYQYRSKRHLLANMLSCSVFLLNNQLNISPTNHSKWEEWEGLGESKHVILSLDHSTEEIGAGLRLALSRCTTKEF